MGNWRTPFTASVILVVFVTCSQGRLAQQTKGMFSPPVVDLVSGNCPRQCHRQGVCTLGKCRCYGRYAGYDCGETVATDGSNPAHPWQPVPDYHPQGEEGSRTATRLPCDGLLGPGRDTLGVWQLCTMDPRWSEESAPSEAATEGRQHRPEGRIPPPSAPTPRRLRICLASSQVMHTPLDVEDLGVGLPAAPLAIALAAAGHEVTVLFAMHGAGYLAHANEWKQQLKQRHGVTLVLLYYTRHYYLSPELANAFEVYAWLVDERSRGAPRFDVIHFHDGNGLGYYTALAKHQNNSAADLSATILVTSVDLPNMFLATKGGGSGVEALETLEVDFIERESARLADAVLFPHRIIAEWCHTRNWKLAVPAWVLPRAVPVAAHEPPSAPPLAVRSVHETGGRNHPVSTATGDSSAHSTSHTPHDMPNTPATSTMPPDTSSHQGTPDAVDKHRRMPTTQRRNALANDGKHRVVFLLEGPGGPIRGASVTGGSRKAGPWGTGVGEQVSQRPATEVARQWAETANEMATADALLATGTVEILESFVASTGTPPPPDSWAARVDAVLFVAMGNASGAVADAVVTSSEQRGKVTFTWNLQRSLLHERLLGGFLRPTDILVLVAQHHRGMRTHTTLRLLAQACVHRIIIASPVALAPLQLTPPGSHETSLTWATPQAAGIAETLRVVLERLALQGDGGDEELSTGSGDVSTGSGRLPCERHQAAELQLLRRWLHFYDHVILPMVPSSARPNSAPSQPDARPAPTQPASTSPPLHPQERLLTKVSPELDGAGGFSGIHTDTSGMVVDETVMGAACKEMPSAATAGSVQETAPATGHAQATARHVAWLAAQGLPRSPAPGSPGTAAMGAPMWPSMDEGVVPGPWGAPGGAVAMGASPTGRGGSLPQGWWERSSQRGLLGTDHPHGAPPSPMSGAFVPTSHWWGGYVPKVSVIMTHFNRHALLRMAVHSIVSQDYPQDRLQLIVVDDGSTEPEVPAALDALEVEFKFAERGWRVVRETNRYLGGARNVGVLHAEGEYFMFVDDDNYAKPHEVSTFVRAMESSGADVLTSFVDFITDKSQPVTTQGFMGSLPSGGAQATGLPSPSFVFLGGSAEVGLFKNCFGDANSFFRASSFLSLGKYTEDKGVGYEDWEIYAKAVLQGYTLEIVPLALYHYRFTAGSMQKNTR
eukprot:jgi/Mesvir1/16148/Mv08419-RA.3